MSQNTPSPLAMGVVDELRGLKERRGLLQQRLERLEEAGSRMPALVLERVRADYENQRRALEAEALPLKARALGEYRKLAEQLAQQSQVVEELTLERLEIELRHQVGEYDDQELATRLSGIDAKLDGEKRAQNELEAHRELVIAVFDSPSELEAAMGAEPTPMTSPEIPLEPSVPEPAAASVAAVAAAPASAPAPAEPPAPEPLAPEAPVPEPPAPEPSVPEPPAPEPPVTEPVPEPPLAVAEPPAPSLPIASAAPPVVSLGKVAPQELGPISSPKEDAGFTPGEPSRPLPAILTPPPPEAPPAMLPAITGSSPVSPIPQEMPVLPPLPPLRPERQLDDTLPTGLLPAEPTPISLVPSAAGPPSANLLEFEGEPTALMASVNVGGSSQVRTNLLQLAYIVPEKPIGRLQQAIPLQPFTTLGRVPDNTVQIEAGEVSRKHAHIVLTTEGWLLRDNKSENGTFLNGHRIAEALLKEGDRVQLSTIGFLFTQELPSP